MANLLKLVGFGVFLLSVVYTTNVTTIPEAPTPGSELVAAKNCTPLSFFRVFSCMYRLGEFLTKMYFLDVDSKSSLQNFHKSCISLHECLSSLNCGSQKTNDTDMIEKIGSYCSGLRYMFHEFQPCMDKFEKQNPDSKCFTNWSPFLEHGKNGTVRTEEEICGNFFGEENCMKKEVVETCGTKDWEGLRNHFIKITPEVKDCGLEKL